MKKISVLVASILMTMGARAQWVKPAAPQAQPMQAGTECYLFNIDAEGFLVGANDWGTRASVSPTLGHKVIIEEGTAEGSYYLVNYVLQGGMANQWAYMFIDDPTNIYVDNTKEGKQNNQYTLEALGDNVYKIGLSPENKDYTNDLMAYIGAIPEKQDTRLYLCDPANEGYDFEGCQMRWVFTSEANYQTYIVARANYDAAMELGKVIDEAKATPGVDYSEAEAVYNNTASTAEQLDAAREALVVAVRIGKLAVASVENPVEVLASMGIATDFNDGQCPGWTSSTGASNKQASNGNNAKDFSVTGNHYENWNGNAFTPGKISATVKDIPDGVYRLTALAFTNTGQGAYLFAGDSRTAVDATQIDADKAFECYTVVKGGEVEIGLDIPEKGPNWVGLDNVYLYCMGNSQESYDLLTQKTISLKPNYEEMVGENGLKCQKSVYEAYVEAKTALLQANAEQYAEAFSQYQLATSAMEASVKAYGDYATKIEEANTWLQNCTTENEYTERLGAYCNDDEPEGYNGHGTSVNILNEGALNAEQLKEETKYLEQLIYDAQSNSMADGDDCTNLLVNPNFSEMGGWTAAQGINWPTGDVAVFPVFEAWGRVCDVYQELNGLQNGLYELSLQAVYMAQGDADIRQTYAYINDYDTKIGITEEGSTVTGANEASAAFAEGKYPVKAYGIVTDGKMRLGITNRLRTGENSALWAGGVKLTFRAKNEEALSGMIEATTPVADNMLTTSCGAPEITALSDAIEAARNAETANEKYDAIIALKAAMKAVEDGEAIYHNLETALFNLEQAILKAPATADPVTLATAQTYFNETDEAFGQKSLSNEEATAAIEQLNTYTVAIKLGQSIATEDNPVDYTSAIVNSTFDPTMGSKDEKRIDGWVVTGALNGYKQNSCSFNKGTFDLHQDLVGLPAGKYKVTVHTFYRAGSYEEEEANINAGRDTHLMKLYANGEEKPVVNLSEGAEGQTLPEGIGTKTINGITVPDGTGASVACFAAGLYLNELTFEVGEDGKATIGLKLDQTIGSNDYTVIGAWNLWYMGQAAPEVTEQEMSNLIINRTFDPTMGSKDEKRIDGWQVEGALNGYKQNSCSFNKGTFRLSQELNGLPKGDYKVTVHTFYRAGSYEEEEANINAGRDTHLMKLFANDQEKPVVNLSEGAEGQTLPEGISTKTINGITVPDGTGASVACFAAGLYLNELNFKVGDDGKAVFGLYLDETIGTNDYTVVGEWNLYYYGDNSADIEKSDVSSLIVNNTFDPTMGSKDEKRIDGWQVEGALNGYKKNTCSFNKGTFDLNQRLVGLPEGTYKVTVHTFYRAGSYEEEEANINAGRDTHLMKMYANTADKNYLKPIINLSEGAEGQTLPEGINTRTICGITVPDGTDASVACFNAGLYLNELPFYVDSNGEVTIGLKLEETIGTNDYSVVGAWNLYYFGSGNHVDEVETAVENVEPSLREATPVAFYNLNGIRLAQPQKGINLIQMSDGTVRKIMIK